MSVKFVTSGNNFSTVQFITARELSTANSKTATTSWYFLCAAESTAD
jgi:hypothetical protein